MSETLLHSKTTAIKATINSEVQVCIPELSGKSRPVTATKGYIDFATKQKWAQGAVSVSVALLSVSQLAS